MLDRLFLALYLVYIMQGHTAYTDSPLVLFFLWEQIAWNVTK